MYRCRPVRVPRSERDTSTGSSCAHHSPPNSRSWIARERENQAFQRLLGKPANIEALTALAERREPDFVAIDAAGL